MDSEDKRCVVFASSEIAWPLLWPGMRYMWVKVCRLQTPQVRLPRCVPVEARELTPLFKVTSHHQQRKLLTTEPLGLQTDWQIVYDVVGHWESRSEAFLVASTPAKSISTPAFYYSQPLPVIFIPPQQRAGKIPSQHIFSASKCLLTGRSFNWAECNA